MKVKCLKCGFTYEIKGTGEEMCPECGCRHWSIKMKESEKLFNKPEEKIDDLYMATINFTVREWLKKKGYMYSEKMGVPDDTMMGLTMKARDKSDRESLERLKKLLEEIHFLTKSWLEKMGVPENPYLPEGYKKIIEERELAFEIFEYFNGKKINVRKIYLNGHIEGFKGDPCIVNHIYPKIMVLKALLQQMNKDYRDFIEKHLLADLPIDPIEFSKFYQSQLERIMNIVHTI